MFTIPYKTNSTHKTYYVYGLQDESGKWIWLNYGLLTDIITLKHLRGNGAFDPDMPIRLTVWNEQPYDTGLQAQNALSAAMRQLCNGYTPALNMSNTINRRMPVRCITTGETYPSAAAASRAYNIPSSRMSNHLNRVKGHRTIAGMTFEYATVFDGVAGNYIRTPSPMGSQAPRVVTL